MRLLHSLIPIDVTRDTSQASMAPCVEPALQFAPVPDSQGPLSPESQYVLSPDPRTSLHAPTHPNSAVCSALRSAKAAASARHTGAPPRVPNTTTTTTTTTSNRLTVSHPA